MVLRGYILSDRTDLSDSVPVSPSAPIKKFGFKMGTWGHLAVFRTLSQVRGMMGVEPHCPPRRGHLHRCRSERCHCPP